MDKRILKALTSPRYAALAVMHKMSPFIKNDELYLKIVYWLSMGKRLNLKNPTTFNEKLQWLKLYNRKPEYTVMVDKVKAKEYVAKIIGEEHIIPTLGVWDDPAEIDFDKLPNQFVLKCSHDSGGLVICRDKAKLDKDKAQKRIEFCLKRNYYIATREYPYKDVPHKILAEKYMTNNGGTEELTDYKFFCFNGHVDCVMVCIDRHIGDTKFYFFNREWKLLRLNPRGIAAPEGFTIPKPANMDEMFDMASKLSQGIPFVRVDLYDINNRIYFGEMTFFPDSGCDPNLLPETDKYFGNLLHI